MKSSEVYCILYSSIFCVCSVLQQILAPFTDFHYRHNADTAEGQLKWVCVGGMKSYSRNKKIVFWHLPLFTVCCAPILVTPCVEKVEGLYRVFVIRPLLSGLLDSSMTCLRMWRRLSHDNPLSHSERFAFIYIKKDLLLILLTSSDTLFFVLVV